jgi:CheY-like chemotaxis protein
VSVLCVGSPGFPAEPFARAVSESGTRVAIAPDPPEALWHLAEGSVAVVVLEVTAEGPCWEVVEAALWQRPPARVIALAAPGAMAGLRRRAYQAGVWELADLPPAGRSKPPATLLASVKRGLARREAGTILLVDDSRDVRDGIGGLIQDEGYRVETAATSAEAVRRMRGRAYALIITEVRKAGPDGYEVLREAARLQPGVPVVVLTAALDDAAFMRCVELGASACLWKLAEPDEILQRIQETLSSPVPGPRRS